MMDRDEFGKKIAGVLGGEVGEIDYTKVRSCPECESLNVSFDANTNKTICRDCKKSSNKPSHVDFQKMSEEIIDAEMENVSLAIKRGTIFDGLNSQT